MQWFWMSPYAVFGAALLTACAFMAPGALADEQGVKADEAGKAQDPSESGDEWQGDPYTLDVCPVTRQKLGAKGDPVVASVDGREFRFCCAGCEPKFRADPAKYLEEVDKAVADQQRERYPLSTCVVSGEELGSMGEPVEKVVKNRLVRLCCAGCESKLSADPAKFVAKLDAAVLREQGADYPLTTCIVSDEPFDASSGPVERVVAGSLVRFCCESCIEAFETEPAKYLSKLDSGK